MLKSKCLNAKITSFHHLGFELDLTFELCHLSLVNEIFLNLLCQGRGHALCLAELL
jgi:hypothetical protein